MYCVYDLVTSLPYSLGHVSRVGGPASSSCCISYPSSHLFPQFVNNAHIVHECQVVNENYKFTSCIVYMYMVVSSPCVRACTCTLYMKLIAFFSL